MAGLLLPALQVRRVGRGGGGGGEEAHVLSDCGAKTHVCVCFVLPETDLSA